MSIASKIQLNSFDSLFGTDEKKDIVSIPLEKLHTFGSCYKSWQKERTHPFKVVDDEKMEDMIESIQEYGVLTPIIVRAKDDEYEIISGHRRTHACEKIGLKTIPAIVKELTDDEAVILMVDSNIQREKILPSEKAFSYKMKLDAMKRQGKRTDLTSSQIGTKLRADEQLAEETGESRTQIQRYIRLTNLNNELLEMVDENKIPVNTAYEFSFLSKNELDDLWLVLSEGLPIPSISQAVRLKELSKAGKLTKEVIEVILTEEKAPVRKVNLKEKTLSQYFPPEYTVEQMEDVIIDLLEFWRSENEFG